MENTNLYDILRLENKSYSILKLVEELAELQEVAIKFVTKPDKIDKERYDKFVEEAGDVMARIQIVSGSLALTGHVETRRDSKLEEIAKFYLKREEIEQ